MSRKEVTRERTDAHGHRETLDSGVPPLSLEAFLYQGSHISTTLQLLFYIRILCIYIFFSSAYSMRFHHHLFIKVIEIWKPSFIPFVRSVSMSTHFEKTFKWNSCFNSMLVFLFACLHINSDCMVIIRSVINLSVKITLQSFLHSKAYWAASFHKKFTYQSIWFTFLKFFFQSWSPGFLWAPVLSFAFYRGPF